MDVVASSIDSATAALPSALSTSVPGDGGRSTRAPDGLSPFGTISEGEEASSTDGSGTQIDVLLSVLDDCHVRVSLNPQAQRPSTGADSRATSVSQTHHWSHAATLEDVVTTSALTTVFDEPGRPGQFKCVSATSNDEDSRSSGPLPVVSLRGALLQFPWPAQPTCMNSVCMRLFSSSIWSMVRLFTAE